LYICFVDFSKAFDLVNRDILFYKIISKTGWYGRVIDTLRSLYKKTRYRVKHNGYLSEPIIDTTGVNQGGIASGLLFRKYMCDLVLYLEGEVGVCVDDVLLCHLLWADDLILLANSPSGLQKQLNGLYNFTADNHAIVNAIKTKCMAFGDNCPLSLNFNGSKILQVDRYKYVGNILRATNMYSEDMFSENYNYLCDQARKALFALERKTKGLGKLPPKLMLYSFDTLVKPILVYGSDVWGANKAGVAALDKVFLRFARCILGVKATTSNIITFGECGQMPPSATCTVSVISFMNRLVHLPDNALVKRVYNELNSLHLHGFRTWVTTVRELVLQYNLDINLDPKVFKLKCKFVVNNSFKDKWTDELNNIQKNPILRTYRQFKNEFQMEPYLDLVQNYKYRNALSCLRASSHTLSVEYGRHHDIPLNMRLCSCCLEIEDELHFVTNCKINLNERNSFYEKLVSIEPQFQTKSPIEKFVYLLSSTNPQILTWFGKYIHHSFITRKEYLNGKS